MLIHRCDRRHCRPVSCRRCTINPDRRQVQVNVTFTRDAKACLEAVLISINRALQEEGTSQDRLASLRLIRRLQLQVRRETSTPSAGIPSQCFRTATSSPLALQQDHRVYECASPVNPARAARRRSRDVAASTHVTHHRLRLADPGRARAICRPRSKKTWTWSPRHAGVPRPRARRVSQM